MARSLAATQEALATAFWPPALIRAMLSLCHRRSSAALCSGEICSARANLPLRLQSPPVWQQRRYRRNVNDADFFLCGIGKREVLSRSAAAAMGRPQQAALGASDHACASDRDLFADQPCNRICYSK